MPAPSFTDSRDRDGTVEYGLPGEALETVINRFATAAALDPFTSWLILPTQRLVVYVSDSLTAKNIPFIPSRICTLEGFSNTIFEEHRTTGRFLSESESKLLLTKILEDPDVTVPLFISHGRPASGTITDLKRFMNVIRMRKVAFPECLLDLQGEKSDQLDTIITTYRSRLRELDLVDEVFYDEKMHYSLLSGYEGISLERIAPQGPSSDRTLWHSASEAAGWGTPGSRNSVFTGQPVSDDQVVLSATRITPDNDGNDDILVIGFKLSGIGNVVSVTLYDESGGLVKKLTDNLLAGAEASVIWNGTSEDGKLVDNGIYILLISVFDDTGKSHRWKKVCTVVRR